MTRVWQGRPGRKENEVGMEHEDLGANTGYPGPPELGNVQTQLLGTTQGGSDPGQHPEGLRPARPALQATETG